jgi:hypothetical protein
MHPPFPHHPYKRQSDIFAHPPIFNAQETKSLNWITVEVTLILENLS